MYSVLSQLIYKQLLSNDLPNAVVDGIAFDGVEAGAVDHFDDLLFGHLHLAFVGVAVGEFAAVGDGAVEIEQRYSCSI